MVTAIKPAGPFKQVGCALGLEASIAGQRQPWKQIRHGNADLRPILLYEGFKGHPLRKDYPKQQEQPLVPYRN